MKYIVHTEEVWFREFHIEADTPEDAVEIARTIPDEEAVEFDYSYALDDYTVMDEDNEIVQTCMGGIIENHKKEES